MRRLHVNWINTSCWVLPKQWTHSTNWTQDSSLPTHSIYWHTDKMRALLSFVLHTSPTQCISTQK